MSVSISLILKLFPWMERMIFSLCLGLAWARSLAVENFWRIAVEAMEKGFLRAVFSNSGEDDGDQGVDLALVVFPFFSARGGSALG